MTSNVQTLESENFCKEKDIYKMKILYLNDRINYALNELKIFNQLNFFKKDLSEYLKELNIEDIKSLHQEYNENYGQKFNSKFDSSTKGPENPK